MYVMQYYYYYYNIMPMRVTLSRLHMRDIFLTYLVRENSHVRVRVRRT